MHVAVTGASGFIGSHVVAALRNHGHTVRCVVRNEQKMHNALDMHRLHVGDTIEIARADLTDDSSLRAALTGTDAVVHVAAVFSLDPNDAKTMSDVNPRSMETIIELADELALQRVVHVSTMGVFTPAPTDHIDLTTPPSHGCGPYTASKIAAERLARQAADRGAPIVSVYPGAVLGPLDPNPHLSDSQIVIRDALQGRIPASVANASLPVIDVRDVGVVCAGAVDGGENDRYLLPGNIMSIAGLFELLGRLTGRDIRLRTAPGILFTTAGTAADLFSRVTKRKMPISRESARMLVEGARSCGTTYDWSPARHDFGVPAHDTATTIRDTIRWMHLARHITDAEAGMAGY